MRRWVAPAALLVVWLMLWGEVSVANLASGVLVVGLLWALVPRLRRAPRHRFHPWGIVLVVVDLGVRLVLSSLQVIRTVLTPTPDRLRSGVVAVPLRSSSPLVATVVADLITLTPGTLTLDVRTSPPEVVVHVLGLDDPDTVRDEVAELEALVLRAVEPLADPQADPQAGPPDRPVDGEEGG